MEVELCNKLSWDEFDLALVLHLSPFTIKRKVSNDPVSLPPSVKVGKKRIWLPSTALEWLKSKEDTGAKKVEFSHEKIAAQPGKRGPGRPRKLVAKGVA